MEANELRLGNLVEYYITDNTDERKEWWEVTKIDVHDLESLSQTNDPDYRPIPLTEDWLLRAGFRKTRKYPEICDKNVFILETNLPIKLILCGNKGFFDCYSDYNPSFKKYGVNFITTNSGVTKLHQLQNLYFALTGNELTFADNHNQCTSDDPDDMCKNCTCWKATRKNCS